MSLEQAIADNTAAIQQLVAISTKLYELRTDAIEQVRSAAASTKGSTTKKTDDKPSDAGKAAEQKANISTGEERVDPNDRAEEIKTAIAGYIGGTEREEERAARKEKVKALLNHEKIVKPESIDLFLKNIAGLTAKGDITEAPKAADKPASDDLDI